MLDKLKGIEERFAELERRLSDPAVIAQQSRICAARPRTLHS